MRRLVEAVCWALLALWATAAPLLWILRDGLGPDAVETGGWPAVRKLLPFLLLGLLLAGLLAVVRRRTQA